jgi:hypothetical protein
VLAVQVLEGASRTAEAFRLFVVGVEGTWRAIGARGASFLLGVLSAWAVEACAVSSARVLAGRTVEALLLSPVGLVFPIMAYFAFLSCRILGILSRRASDAETSIVDTRILACWARYTPAVGIAVLPVKPRYTCWGRGWRWMRCWRRCGVWSWHGCWVQRRIRGWRRRRRRCRKYSWQRSRGWSRRGARGALRQLYTE